MLYVFIFNISGWGGISYFIFGKRKILEWGVRSFFRRRS